MGGMIMQSWCLHKFGNSQIRLCFRLFLLISFEAQVVDRLDGAGSVFNSPLHRKLSLTPAAFLIWNVPFGEHGDFVTALFSLFTLAWNNALAQACDAWRASNCSYEPCAIFHFAPFRRVRNFCMCGDKLLFDRCYCIHIRRPPFKQNGNGVIPLIVWHL